MRIGFATILFALAMAAGCGKRDFDSAFGFDAIWAAEKNLISLFRREGFPAMRSLDRIENSVFERPSDGAKVNYAYGPILANAGGGRKPRALYPVSPSKFTRCYRVAFHCEKDQPGPILSDQGRAPGIQQKQEARC